METEELHPAVQLILKRMDTNPEEFEHPSKHAGKNWGLLLDQYKKYLTPVETKAIDAKICLMRKDELHREVMKALLQTEEELTAGTDAKMIQHAHMQNVYNQLGLQSSGLSQSTVAGQALGLSQVGAIPYTIAQGSLTVTHPAAIMPLPYPAYPQTTASIDYFPLEPRS